MKRKIYTTTVIFLLTLVSLTASAQDLSDQAKTYFAKHLDSKAMAELILKSLPTLEEYKSVFKEPDAETYFKAVEEMKAKQGTELSEETEAFADVRVESFSTRDIKEGNGNYAGGMEGIVDRLQPDVVFYKISLLREKDAERGLAFKYWGYINGRWVFFPKPYSVFEK